MRLELGPEISFETPHDWRVQGADTNAAGMHDERPIGGRGDLVLVMGIARLSASLISVCNDPPEESCAQKLFTLLSRLGYAQIRAQVPTSRDLRSAGSYFKEGRVIGEPTVWYIPSLDVNKETFVWGVVYSFLST